MRIFGKNKQKKNPAKQRQTLEHSAVMLFLERGALCKILIGVFSFLSVIGLLVWQQKIQLNDFSMYGISNFLIGCTLFIWGVFILIINYLQIFHESVYKSNSKLFLISVLSVLALVVAKLITHIPFNPELPWVRYLTLMPTFAFLMAILLNQDVAFFMVVINCILTAVIRGYQLDIFLVSLISAFISVFSASAVRKRHEIFKAGFYIVSASVFTIISLGVMLSVPFRIYMLHSIGGILSGVVAVMLSISLLPLLEYFFKITTDMTFLELSDFNHPLLKRLVIEAPGTYHHSLMVGNLAEAAAEEVGANPLLARVASYFHDIGKLKKPEYFVENAWHQKSRHEDLIPSMSSLIIISHVKDGVDLARKFNINREIIDIIQQHHGTSLVYFFYRRATEKKLDKDKVSEEHYRYPGAKPQSKEAAIVMIADSVEAASRTLESPTPSRIESLVKDVIKDKINDNQMDECDLTLHDLHLICNKFCRLLNATFHARVKYPEKEKNKDGKAGLKNAGSDKQFSKTSKDK